MKDYMCKMLVPAVTSLALAANAAFYVATPENGGDDANLGTESQPLATIQTALDKATGWGSAVYIKPGIYKISEELLLKGDGISIRSVSGDPKDVTIDAQGLCRCLDGITGGHYNIYLRGITFLNGASTGNGGGVYLGGNCTVDDCVFSNCTSTAKGGAIWVQSSTHVFTTRIYDCHATSDGGAIAGWQTRLSGVVITNCTAGGYGGAVHFAEGTYYIENTEVYDCRAKQGGGLYVLGRDTGWATNVTIRGCRAVNNGDAIGGGAFMRQITLDGFTVTDCHCEQTQASGHPKACGGGIYLYNATLSNSTVTACSVGSSVLGQYNGFETGGGVHAQYYDGYARKLHPEIVGCTVKDCWATNDMTVAGTTGGGINVDGSCSNARVENCDVSGNFSNITGAGMQVGGTGSIVKNCTVTNNVCRPTVDSAASGGSGIKLGTAVTIDGCLIQGNSFTNNVAQYNAGGSAVWLGGSCRLINSAVIGNSGSKSVCFQGTGCGDVLVSNCLFKANRATLSGNGGRGGQVGFYDLRSGGLTITDCRFIDNSSVCDYGGVFEPTPASNGGNWLIRNCLFTGNSGKDLIWVLPGGTATDTVTLENCTIVSNAFTASPVISPYVEGTKYPSEQLTYVKGCAILFNNGKNAFSNSYKNSGNIAYSCAENISSQDGNIVYDPSKPLFTDIANGDYSLAEHSQLRNKVPAANWMGDGSRKGRQDIGSGYELAKAGMYGVNVIWKDTNPRLGGEYADIGCCELRSPAGMVILCR